MTIETEGKIHIKPTICVDKLHLVTKMDKETISIILKQGKFISNEYYYHVQRFDNPSFLVFVNPVSISAYKNYNVMITFNPAKMNNLPPKLDALIDMSRSWRIRRVDIAIDFPIPIRNSFLMPYRNTKVKSRLDNDNRYFGSKRNKCVIAHYDKKLEQQAKGYEFNLPNLTRLEFRLRENLNKQPVLHDLNFEWVRKHMDKGLFVPDYTMIQDARAVDLIRNLNEKKREYSSLTKRERVFLGSVVREHGMTFYEQFSKQTEELFRFIKRKESS